MKKFRKVQSYESDFCYYDGATGAFIESHDGRHDFEDLDLVAHNCAEWCEKNNHTFAWITFSPTITYQLEEE